MQLTDPNTDATNGNARSLIVRSAPDASNEDRDYLHSVLCQVGLPRSATKERTFSRSNGSAFMMIEAGRWHDGKNWEEMPLPFGTRPRLVLLHVCSEAIRTRSPEVEVENSVRGFLRRLRISEGGESMAAFKKQMRALAACRMQLAYKTGSRMLNIKCDPIEQFDAWLQDEEGQSTMWPGVIKLSDKFFNSLAESAVPLDAGALASLQNSALALDTYTWLAHRLFRIDKPSGQIIHWKSLREQFGQEYKSDRDFKREFLTAVKKAMAVYPAARIEQIRGGVKLLPSAPPVKASQTAVRLSSPLAKKSPTPKPAITKLARVKVVSDAALDQAAQLGVGEDPHQLEAMYAGILNSRKTKPKDIDADFLRWAKAFGRNRGTAAASPAPSPSSIDFVISDAARREAAQIARGGDITDLERRYREWVAKRGEAPLYPNKAFPKWVERDVGSRR